MNVKQIAKDEFTANGRRLLVSTVEMWPGKFETLVMYASNYMDIDGKNASTEEDAKRNHADALKACENVHDGGACNHDAPALFLPRWNAAQIEKAAKYAGVGCFAWDSFGPRKWVFCPRISGQAYRREKCSEYMTEALRRAGYDALEYCALD